MNDMEDDVHMTTETPTNVLINALVSILKPEIAKVFREEMEFYMDHYFDINDYIRKMDTNQITENIVEEVIDSIKERL